MKRLVETRNWTIDVDLTVWAIPFAITGSIKWKYISFKILCFEFEYDFE